MCAVTSCDLDPDLIECVGKIQLLAVKSKSIIVWNKFPNGIIKVGLRKTRSSLYFWCVKT